MKIYYYLFLFAAVTQFGMLTAQPNIIQAEYFFDTDPGFGNGIAISVAPSPNVTLTFSPNITSLTDGFHTLYVRGKDSNGNWSIIQARSILKFTPTGTPTISSFNPSSGLVGSTVVITGSNFSNIAANNTVRFNGVTASVTAATTTSLTVTVPAGATSGLISVVVAGLTASSSSAFTVLSPNITALEYFFNIDPGPGNGTPITITPGTTIDLTNINIPTTSLSVGWHTLCVRSRDANNVWGFYECRQIYIREAPPIIPTPVVEPITAMEFFYNTDNGPGSGTAIPITSNTDIDLVNNNLANTLPVGWHTVSVRAKNNANVWGFYESRRIYVRESAQPCCTPASPIVELEWFVDADPGAGLSATRKTINPSQANIDLVDEPLYVGVQTVGAHQIFIRAKNQAGDWSMSERASFTVITPCSIINAPSATGVNRCDPGTVTLTGSGASGGETYRWYATNTSNTPLFTGNPFTTPVISVNMTYYVSAYNPTTFCESGRTPVTAGVSGIPKPVLNVTGSLAVCEGVSQVLTAPNGFVSYTWSNGLTTQQITVNTTGTYSVVVNNGICSSPPSDGFAFTVNTRPVKPTITSTGGGSLCGIGSVTLSAPAGFNAYAWSSGQTTADITVTNAGNFSVSVTNAAGCQSATSDIFSVTANAISKPIVSITGSPSLCNGSTAKLDAPAGFSGYAWSNGATTAQITVSTAGNYTVSVTNGACSSPDSDPVVVTTSTRPTKPAITVSGNLALCNGAFAVLSAPAGFSQYAWSNGETTRQIVVTTAGAFAVQVGNALNCLSLVSDAVTTTVTGLPCTATTPSQPTVTGASRCGSGTVLLTASGATVNQEYRWYDVPTGGTSLTTSATFTTPVITATTSYYVSIFDTQFSTEGNRAIVSAQVVTLAKPAISPAGNITICQGSSTLLSAPVGFSNYLWSTGAVTQQIAVSAAGTYSVQTGDGTCWSPASDNTEVSIAPALGKPTVTTVGSATLCAGGSVELQAPTGFTSYSWSTGATTANITVSAAGNYSVTVGNGICVSLPSDDIRVTSVATPTKPLITITGSTSLCNNAFVVLTSTSVFAHYKWSTGEISRQITVSDAGDFTLQVGNAANCLSEASSIVVVTATGQPCATATPPIIPTASNASRCGSGSITLTASGALATHQYRWYSAATSGTLVGDKIDLTVTLAQTTDYYVCSIDPVSNTESNRLRVTATIFQIPSKPVVTAVGREFICSGSLVALTAPTGFTNYKWSTDETTQTILVDKSGSYSVQTGMSATCLSPKSDVRAVALGTPAQCGVIPSPTNKAPTIRAFTFGVQIQSSISYSLVDLVADENNNLDISSLAIISQPSKNGKASGGKAELEGEATLKLTYTGINFAGEETITLQVCDTDGLCTQKDMVVDVVGDVVVYNGITPDGDGINDFMRIEFIDVLKGATKNKVIILNRWGDIVFEMDDYNNVDRVFAGRGTNGQELPAGVYLYKVELADGKRYTGFITLKK